MWNDHRTKTANRRQMQILKFEIKILYESDNRYQDRLDSSVKCRLSSFIKSCLLCVYWMFQCNCGVCGVCGLRMPLDCMVNFMIDCSSKSKKLDKLRFIVWNPFLRPLVFNEKNAAAMSDESSFNKRKPNGNIESKEPRAGKAPIDHLINFGLD